MQSGTLLKGFYNRARALLQDPDPYTALPGRCHTKHVASLALAMVLRAVGGVSHMLPDWSAGYPCKLFGLLAPDPAEKHCRASEI
eukprot:6886109-Heterocapsa_arctica.AAC.1